MRHAPTGETRILIVEDKVIIGMSLQETLVELGYPCTETVADGEEAAESAARFRPDLALVDLDMAEPVDALALARELREAGVPLVFLGGKLPEDRLHLAEALDPFGYLHKPVTERDLSLTVEMATRRVLAERELRARARQQDAIARLGLEALKAADPETFLNQAVKIAADTLKVPFSRIVEITADRNHGVLKYGVGWRPSALGHETANLGRGSLSGFALATGGPVLSVDLRHETRFFVPPVLREHGIVSTLTTVIPGTDGPYGVLGVDTDSPRLFSESDIDFMRAVAHTISHFLLLHEAREQLRRTLAYAQSILENAVDAYLSTDTEGRITDWNGAAEQLLGWSRKEILGKDLAATLVPPRYHDDYRRAMERLTAGTEGRRLTTRLELIARHRDGGEIPVQVALFSTRRDGEHWFNAFIHDRRLQTFATLDLGSEEQRQKFFQYTTHDLREPLLGIQLYTQLLGRQFADKLGPDGGRYLEFLSSNARRMDEMVQQLAQMVAGEGELGGHERQWAKSRPVS